MDTPTECPVCLSGRLRSTQVRNAKRPQIRSEGHNLIVDCDTCGQYVLSKELWTDVLSPESHGGRRLSDVCRARLSHRLITGATTDPSKRLMLTRDYLDRFIARGCPGPTPGEQAINIIKYVGNEISQSGKRIDNFPTGFYAIIGAPNPEFADELTAELVSQGILTGLVSESIGGYNIADIGLTLGGWDRFEAEKRGLQAGNYGFIAMKFDDAELDPFIETVVKPTVREGIGYDLVDMRDVARAGLIDNIMRAQIRDAAFVIVDLTHDNSGAYWEAGYAEGLGKQVIYICKKAKFDEAKTHFDTNHCTTVLWSPDSGDDFRQELIATIRRSLNLFPSA